ncbi:MAG: hypothetical protein INR68_18580 [Methylobacterium mesophilicum]|nr:hypothetical protein [Methylobacterium mesophilicum]
MGAADRYHADAERERAVAIARLPWSRWIAHRVGAVSFIAAILLAALIMTGGVGTLFDLWRWMVSP